MNELLKKAQEHLQGAEVVRGTPDADRGLLRWSVAYALVATAEGVWKLVELMHKVYDQEIELHEHQTVTGRAVHDHPFSEQIERDVQ